MVKTRRVRTAKKTRPSLGGILAKESITGLIQEDLQIKECRE